MVLPQNSMPPIDINQLTNTYEQGSHLSHQVAGLNTNPPAQSKHSNSANVMPPVRRGISSTLAAPAASASNTNLPAAASASVAAVNSSFQMNQQVRNSDSANLKEQSGGGASNSSTNQWTPEEKKIYVNGLKKYGKNFVKISDCLKRRTPD